VTSTPDPIRILVVEDNPDYADVIGELLRDDEYPSDVAYASNLHAALDRVTRERFDVVLLDLTLPDSSGIEGLNRLAERAPLLPVVVLTAIDNEEVTARALREGAQDFLLKTDVDGEVLHRSIRYAIDRHAFEARLRRSEERYRSLIESSTQGILIHADGVVALANRALVDLVGLSGSEQVIGRSIWPFVVVEDQPIVERMMRERGQGMAVPDHYDFRIRRADGAIAWVECAATAISWDGTPAFMATFLDVTARKRTEEQLRQAQRMEAVGRLAGGIAHDFNNLLVVMSGHSELLLEELGDDHPAAPSLREIETAAQSAANLTRQLLALSRRQLLQPQIIDLNQVLKRVQSLLSRVIGEDIQISLNLAPELHYVLADPGQIEQVVMNLAVNARDAMPGGGRLVLRTANVDVDSTCAAQHPGARIGPHAMLSITDTGSGIDDATLKQVFEPFFTTKEPGKGTGLGLATVYGIVKQSGGFVTVYTQLRKGSTFSVFLPLAEVATTAEPESAEPAGPRGTETVLLIEDQYAVRAVTRDALQRFGYAVIEAGSGDEAIRTAMRAQQRIDLVITDVVLLGISGRDAARRICSFRPEARVLYISGYTDDAIAHHGVLDKGLAFLEKPFTPAKLARKVREVLDAPQAPGI